MTELQDEAQRRRAIALAIALTADTHLAPDQYEFDLLESYAQGERTLNQVLLELDTRVQHLLYRSQAVELLTAVQLTELLEESRAWNRAHGITGLLCYGSDGHFVQVLEGPAHEVHALYVKIQRDKRHQNVQLLSNKAASSRWFTDWQMAFVETDAPDFFWLISYLEAREHNLVMPQIPITEPLLLTLLNQFSRT
ncbi:hypothetical protein GO988_11940 [Hymenobacter sp. HMF4947]|uniref:BLUF domain-containing protein n=1 Tax=Hymenobacter ginkgonis TaxID=2682976 RepID=A0A7K1TF51_9BACT|nr:BLUF domain-containing protein [Hymenobacter ginkgonis]MVN77037.1 hypothetical protein [Hymenobacter ginkgonis]